MKRIAVFNVKQSVEANEHLAKFPPEQVGIVDDMIVINYDDQLYPDSYKAEEIRGLILSNIKGMMTTEISIKVSLLEIEDARASLVINEENLAKLEETNITSLSETTMDKAELKELKKDRQEKINAHRLAIQNTKDAIKNMENATAGLRKSIKNFENKNKILNEELALLKL